MILETIYKFYFRKESFSFCRSMGTHDALEYVKLKFRWIDLVSEGDIESVYSTIDHDRVCKILGKKIQDVRFVNLIQKLLKCGILPEEQFTCSNLCVP